MVEEIIYNPITPDSLAENLTYGIEISAFAIITAGLIGFTITKFIKLMKGRF